MPPSPPPAGLPALAPLAPLATHWAALAVGAGGFVGAIARWALSSLAARLAPVAAFPVGTFAVNLLGCVAIGAVATHLMHRDPPAPEVIRLVAVTGLLGAFTTFSTFGLETLTLVRDRQLLIAAAYVAGSVLLGVLGVLIGRSLALALTLAPR